MDSLLALPFWRCQPYVRPNKETPNLKRSGETLDQNRKRKLQKAIRVAKFHEKVLNKVG